MEGNVPPARGPLPSATPSRSLCFNRSTGSIDPLSRIAAHPFGGVHQITGTASLDARLPGQWFNLETGLHYNWHRSYDPTLGRYTQADPLGFPDGPSRYTYAVNSPQVYVDPSGEFVPLAYVGAIAVGAATGAALDLAMQYLDWKFDPMRYMCRGYRPNFEPDYRSMAFAAAFGAATGPVARFGWLGKEITFGKNFRFAPGGNRPSATKPNPWFRKFPHYHRRGRTDPKTGRTVDGQGIGRHRPFETKSSDTRFLDRF